MVEDRNGTAHTYDENSAKMIYRALPEYARLLKALLEGVKQGESRRAGEGS